ncbi:hypothetical protein CNR22_23455 [Sphingobacteriaceae bacterium]|nr:hypothetical protein CNR22_23455 [Sphingobacteriaceae bacterium]
MIKRFIFCLLFLDSLLSAQTYNFAHYAEENGLMQSYIYNISQSREGLLTLSTGETVSWFDGDKFTSFSNKELAEQIESTHFVDSRGITWLGHQNGLSYYQNGKCHKFANKEISALKITQIAEDDKKCIWVATSGGLFKINPDFKVNSYEPTKKYYINSFLGTSPGHLLIATTEGLISATLNTKEDRLVASTVDIFENKNVKQIIKAVRRGTQYWLNVEGEGVYGVRFKGMTCKIFQRLFDTPDYANSSIRYIYKDHSNNLWVSVFGDGVRKLSFSDSRFFHRYTMEKISSKNGLGSDNIQTIFQDAEGNIWFGTFGEGLIKKPVELFSFFGKGEGFQEADINAISGAERGDLWLGTNKGLALYNKESGNYTLYNAANGFIDGHVNTVLADNGSIWIGTQENGIYIFDPAKKRFKNFSQEHRFNHLTINCIRKINDKIMIGTTDGLYIYAPDSKNHEDLSTNDGLFHNNIVDVFMDSRERLWIASHGAPPYYIKDQKITALKKIEGMTSYNVNAFCEDILGNIWIATDGDGVFRYNNSEFRQYTANEGLISNYCTGIIVDRNNAIWVTHRSGISMLQKGRSKFISYARQKGLMFNENNLNAIFKDEVDNLWFGTNKGLVVYDAKYGGIEVKTPEIFISGIQMNDINQPLDKIIEMEYNYYSVHIDFKAVSLSDPNSIVFKYRLLDVDKSFNTTSMPYVDFPKLGDGSYTFEVLACNVITGQCNKIPAKISFVIAKPIWKSVWFYLLLIFLVVLLMNVVVILRTRSLKRTQQLLEMRIEQKTFLLKREKEAVEEIKVQLEHKNKDITDSILYAKNIQDSLLPPEGLMKEMFSNNYFVLYKPKDIVSGDFYWCAGHTKAKSGLEFAGVIDCTGHGVPGAFLSILANDFLDRSLIENPNSKPNEILDYLNESVSSHLNQQWSKNKIRDGMDISLIGIDYKNMKLYYSGANNPIYIFRKKDEGLEEIILKATKQAIGSVHEVIVKYELKVMDLMKGDTIYLFSDGFADQFGGPRNKKITYRTFRTILARAFPLPMNQQVDFIESGLEAWQRDTEQTDDICVLGIRM